MLTARGEQDRIPASKWAPTTISQPFNPRTQRANRLRRSRRIPRSTGAPAIALCRRRPVDKGARVARRGQALDLTTVEASICWTCCCAAPDA
jgi:hypothetical protein